MFLIGCCTFKINYAWRRRWLLANISISLASQLLVFTQCSQKARESRQTICYYVYATLYSKLSKDSFVCTVCLRREKLVNTVLGMINQSVVGGRSILPHCVRALQNITHTPPLQLKVASSWVLSSASQIRRAYHAYLPLHFQFTNHSNWTYSAAKPQAVSFGFSIVAIVSVSDLYLCESIENVGCLSMCAILSSCWCASSFTARRFQFVTFV